MRLSDVFKVKFEQKYLLLIKHSKNSSKIPHRMHILFINLFINLCSTIYIKLLSTIARIFFLNNKFLKNISKMQQKSKKHK